MVDLPSRNERNKLRQIVSLAEQNEIMTKEEAGFVIALIERFRVDIEKKVKEAFILEGQIAQLRNNEQIIVQLIENMISAAERDSARRATMEKLREARDVEETRRAAHKVPTEGADVDEAEQEIKEQPQV
jgi:hypothetical protein